MLRTALKPRWLGLFAVLVVVVVTFCLLGMWQLNVAESKGQKSGAQLADRPRVALQQALQPAQPFPRGGSLRPVSILGHYVPAQQVLVSGRVLGQQRGYWVVTGFRVQSNGATIPIVRGFVSAPDQATRPTEAAVTVEGALAPGEAPSSLNTPAGELSTVDLSRLLNDWGGSFYNAFVFMTAEHPTVTGSPIQTFPPPSPGGGGLQWRNAGYALQWWVFAGFAIFIFWRMLRDDYRDDLAAGEPTAAGSTEPAATRPATSGPVAEDPTAEDNDQHRDLPKETHA